MPIAILRPLLALAVLAMLVPTRPACADAIDGNWCFADGRRMSINGPEIVTPGGVRTLGSYSRHAFSYTVPPAESGAGSMVSMTLVNEETVHLRMGAGSAGAASADLQVWRRCFPITS